MKNTKIVLTAKGSVLPAGVKRTSKWADMKSVLNKLAKGVSTSQMVF